LIDALIDGPVAFWAVSANLVEAIVMEPVIRPLRARELRRGSRLLARAFADDSFIGYFLANRRRRELAFPRFFRAVLHQLFDAGAVLGLEADGTLIGVAAWAPPEVPPPTRRSRSLARLAALQVRMLFPSAAPRLLAGFEKLAESHPQERHWYLAFVGIEPGQQRRGLGQMLLAPIIVRSDKAGVACYLETPFPDTRAFYRRIGFEQMNELRPVAEAPPIWTMIRRPKAPAVPVGGHS
jgi:ribosomal protein S18 acetylase RimI-like enzyme